MVPFRPIPFCPTMPFCPNIPCFIFPQRLRLEKTHHVNYNITRCSIKWCEHANMRYIIVFNHVRWFYFSICQSKIDVKMWVDWLTKRVKFRFCATLKAWSIASLISMYDAELADDRNQVDAKIGQRLACFIFKTPGFPFCPHVPFCPDLLYIIKLGILVHPKEYLCRHANI